MKNSIIIVGMGELGSVFARGFLKLGYSVQAITRKTSMVEIAKKIPKPTAVLIAVGEADIHRVMQNIPNFWRQYTILIQNELLPKDWLNAGLNEPTVISIWFEKKKGIDIKIITTSPVFGKHSQLVVDALDTLDLPAKKLDNLEQLKYELVRKNCYILTTNIAGLEVGGNVKELAENHNQLMLAVANDVLDIQDSLTLITNEREKIIKGMLESFAGDPEHNCMGRSASARLNRALNIAKAAGLSVKKLNEIADKHLK